MSDFDQLAYNLRKPLAPWLLPFTAENVGTWAPGLLGAGVPGTFTYAASTGGQWVRLGNMVFVTGRIVISAIGVAATGNLHISGLPFTSASGYADGTAGNAMFGFWYGITLTGGRTQLGGWIQTAQTLINLAESGSGVVAAQVQGGALALIGGFIDIPFSAVYQVA